MNMRVRNILVLLAGLMAAAQFTGCSQKKPVVAAPQPAPPTAAAPPAQAQPTPAEAQPQTQSQASPTQGTPPPEPQPAQQTTEQPPPAAEKPQNAKTKTAKPRSNGKKGGTETARNTTKTVVKPDGAEPAPAAGQISPSLSHAEVAHDQATTDQLLQSAEATLNGIKRQLSQDEQATVAQIRDYVNQSRQATKANDLARAYNLAVKARLLSDDLAKRR